MTALSVLLMVLIVNRRTRQAGHGPWSWVHFAVAMGLVSVGCFLFFICFGNEFRNSPDPTIHLVLLLGVSTAGAGPVWILVMFTRLFWPTRKN